MRLFDYLSSCILSFLYKEDSSSGELYDDDDHYEDDEYKEKEVPAMTKENKPNKTLNVAFVKMGENVLHFVSSMNAETAYIVDLDNASPNMRQRLADYISGAAQYGGYDVKRLDTYTFALVHPKHPDYPSYFPS